MNQRQRRDEQGKGGRWGGRGGQQRRQHKPARSEKASWAGRRNVSEWAATKGRWGSRVLFVMRLKSAVVASHSAQLGAAGTAATAPPSCRSSLCCAVLCCSLLFVDVLFFAAPSRPSPSPSPGPIPSPQVQSLSAAVCGRPSWYVTVWCDRLGGVCFADGIVTCEED